MMGYHQSSQLTGKAVEENDVTIANFVEHGNHITLAKGGSLGGLNGVYVTDIATVTDGVIVDEIADILYQTVVAHAHVAQGGTLDARVLEKAFAHFNLFLKLTNADVTIK